MLKQSELNAYWRASWWVVSEPGSQRESLDIGKYPDQRTAYLLCTASSSVYHFRRSVCSTHTDIMLRYTYYLRCRFNAMGSNFRGTLILCVSNFGLRTTHTGPHISAKFVKTNIILAWWSCYAQLFWFHVYSASNRPASASFLNLLLTHLCTFILIKISLCQLNWFKTVICKLQRA